MSQSQIFEILQKKTRNCDFYYMPDIIMYVL